MSVASAYQLILNEQNLKIDLIVLDLTIKGGLGALDVMKYIKKKKINQKVILSSGYNEEDATDRFSDKGLAGFLQKPYTSRTLRAKMKHAMEG